MSWLKGFFDMVQISDELSDQEQKWVENVDRMEEAVAELRNAQPRFIGKKVLERIVDSSGGTYSEWWTDQSSALEKPKPVDLLGEDLSLRRSRDFAINRLYERLKPNIEVVSVILRFWCPVNFGIFSPPVAWILALAPTKDHKKDYKRYLDVLARLRDHHGLKRLADVDLALWGAARLTGQYPYLAKEMNRDTHFLAIRLDNLLYGLGNVMRGEPLQQSCLASALFDRDPLTAALVASRPCEWAVCAGASRFPGVERWERRCGTSKLIHYKEQLRSLGFLEEVERELGFNLSGLIVLRNESVHFDEIKAEEAEYRAAAFIGATNELIKWAGSRSRG